MAKIGENVKVRPMWFWSHKVLPLVYDDSLSYYEVIGKLVHKTNEVIDAINDGLEQYVRENLDDIYADSFYDSYNETLVLILKEGK